MSRAIAESVAGAYAGLDGNGPAMAVRSSATAEDLPDLSFAGQQETYLNVRGVAAVQDAVKRCWASLWTARAIGYRLQHGVDQDQISLAVVVQRLVPAEAAGVLFTAHPVTGQRDRAMISAAWGLGESVVGGTVTPDTLVVDKANGRVLERETADKQMMTVRVGDAAGKGTAEQPVPEDLRRAPVLDDATAAELVRLGVQIEQLYDMPIDIEWTLSDGKLAVVQARPITALPSQAPLPPPVEWPLPDPKGQYMRASIIDMMPDPVSPLFATLGFGAVSTQLRRVMSDVTRSRAVLPQPYFVTINDYAYQNARLDGRMLWWTLTGMLPAFPRMLRMGIPYWQDTARPLYVETVQRWQARLFPDLTASQLLAGARELVDAAMYNLTAEMTWMGAVAGTEMLFTRVYDKIVKRTGDPEATTFLMGYDSAPIRAEKILYDLATWCRTRDALAAYVLDTPSAQLVARLEGDAVSQDGAVGEVDWQAFRQRFGAYLEQFGHVIYDLDFAKPLPRDDPTPMLETVKMYLRSEGNDPYERQKTLETRRVQASEAVLGRVKRLKRWLFTKTLYFAQKHARVREDGLADIGLGYPVLRRLLHELGRRFVAAGGIEQAGDIFWLRQNEVEQAVAALERGESPAVMSERVREREVSWQASKRVAPPPMLPPKKKYMGFNVEGLVAADGSDQTGNTIKGMGTSAGRVSAPACVLHGPEDFGRMRPGHVLVAGITTPAWTPLFAMASGVVTDVGGPLSHGSIVAREYGIPAVLGTGVATRRIHSGQTITVDGSAGTVTLVGKVLR
jgi:pyruvate,water dikinase